MIIQFRKLSATSSSSLQHIAPENIHESLSLTCPVFGWLTPLKLFLEVFIKLLQSLVVCNVTCKIRK